MNKFVLFAAATLIAACRAEKISDNKTGAGTTEPECRERSDDCQREMVCVDGNCESAFPRIYTISMEIVHLPAMDPDTTCWDTPCSAADPFIVVGVGAQQVGQTTAVQDQSDVSFAETFDVQLIAGTQLQVAVFDEDIAVDDLPGGWDPIRATLLRTRVFNSSDLGVA